jgi:glycosyltransferase involved in cell wall biosynthesis
MPSSALVSAVIPTKNRPDSLRRMIDSLRRQDYPNIEIVVVDDGSEPPVAALDPDITVVRNETSGGACFARNRGVERARGQYVAFFDDDAELYAPDVIGRAVAWIREGAAEIVAFRQVDANGQIRGVNPATTPGPVQTGLFFTYGCLLTAESVRAIPFREAFIYYHEEADFSLRALERGYRIVYDPSLSVVHHEDDRERNWRRVSRLACRNMILTALLDYPVLLVGPGMLRSLRNGVNAFRSRVGWDIEGKVWAMGDALRLFRLSDRDPVSLTTLLRYRDLARNPRPVELKHLAAGNA